MSQGKSEYKDPFNAGQMVGMLVILSIIEKNGGIDQILINKIKLVSAENASEYFCRPAEDVCLMIDNLVKGINE